MDVRNQNPGDRNQMIKSFEDLEVFQRAYKLSLEIHKVTLEFPKREQYGLADQIRRQANLFVQILQKDLPNNDIQVLNSNVIL